MLITAFLCLQASSLVPGQRIGGLILGTPAAAALAKLGPTNIGDAAMLKAWGTWIGKDGNRLDVYTITPNDQPIIQIVRATSPFFRTSGGISTASTPGQVRGAFPKMIQVANYVPKSVAAPTQLWDDASGGIAAEFSGGRTVALSVHLPGQPINSGYLKFTTYLAGS